MPEKHSMDQFNAAMRNQLRRPYNGGRMEIYRDSDSVVYSTDVASLYPKIALNSIYGKFGEKSSMKQTKIKKLTSKQESERQKITIESLNKMNHSQRIEIEHLRQQLDLHERFLRALEGRR